MVEANANNMKLTEEQSKIFKSNILARNWTVAIKLLPEGPEKWIMEDHVKSFDDQSKTKMYYAIHEIIKENKITF